MEPRSGSGIESRSRLGIELRSGSGMESRLGKFVDRLHCVTWLARSSSPGGLSARCGECKISAAHGT